MKKINIAIDGPSGAGKSTISDLLAKEFGYIHLDTGAMYRAVAYYALENQLALDEEDKIADLIQNMTFKQTVDGHILLNGKDVSAEIRTNEISMAASDVSKLLKIRQALVAMQQDISREKGYIVDGRDIGTVVLTDAEVKVFLIASAEERAKRRCLQNQQKGLPADYEMILKDIEARDYQDSHRANSPLKKADDAVEVDSSFLTIEETVSKIAELIRKELHD